MYRKSNDSVKRRRSRRFKDSSVKVDETNIIKLDEEKIKERKY